MGREVEYKTSNKSIAVSCWNKKLEHGPSAMKPAKRARCYSVYKR